MTAKRYKALLLDVDGTLLDFYACARESMAEAAREGGVILPPEFEATFHRVNGELWQALERGDISREELYRVRFARIFAQTQTVGDGAAFEERFRAALSLSHVPVEGAAEILPYLASRYRLCVASNAVRAQQLRRLEAAGMAQYFAAFVCADDPETRKPTPAFFHTCLACFPDIDPCDVLMIGDSPTADAEGAGASGLDALWYNPRHQSYAFSHPPVGEFHSLRELFSLL